jgi:hypothetical protein
MEIDKTPDRGLPLRILQMYLELAQERLAEDVSNAKALARIRQVNEEQRAREDVLQEAIWLLEAANQMDQADFRRWQLTIRRRHQQQLVFQELTVWRRLFDRMLKDREEALPPEPAAQPKPAES